MEPVLCEICNKSVLPETCWCVIDTRNKTRHFECKVNCKPSAPLRAAPAAAPPEPDPEPFEIDIPDDVIIRRETVPEWAEDYPRPTFIQRMKLWFTRPSGYTKVKTH
jgi:hypothetical protein